MKTGQVRSWGMIGLTIVFAWLLIAVCSGDVLGAEKGKGQQQPPKRAPGRERESARGKAAPKTGVVRVLTDDEVSAAVKNGYSVIYFSAKWCGPCRTQGPIMDKVAKKYDGKVKVFKMDVDSDKETADKFKIKQIPAMVLFRQGKPAIKLIGLIQEDEFDDEIEQLMKKSAPKGKAPAGKK